MPLVMLLVFALTLFSNATLLFFVQPMVGKMILPLLGGTPAVWNTCMVFFQAILLAGYAYAHATPARLGARKQAGWHLLLLFVPLFFLPLTVREGLITGGSENPAFQVLLLLLVMVGVPFFVVSTSAPLLQTWFADTNHPAAKDPYFLYGASNLGSMVSLIAYPTLVEPYFTLTQQTHLWVVGYCLVAALMGCCAVLLWMSPRPTPGQETVGEEMIMGAAVPALDAARTTTNSQISERFNESKRKKKRRAERGITPAFSQLQTQVSAAPERPTPADANDPATQPVTWMRRLRWIMLAFVPSSLMLGATTYITTDIAPIPLLWIAPLAIYLFSFILVFANMSTRTQNVVVFTLLMILLASISYGVPGLGRLTKAGVYTNWMVFCLFIWAACIAGVYFGFRIFRLKEPRLLHQSMVLGLPLVVLILDFMMLTDIKPKIGLIISLHLLLLFFVSMVCHGGMAHDRPSTKHLTEFFLTMSAGGVLGGLFNALFAPIAFNSLAEYPLAMVLACLLLPPLTVEKQNRWSSLVDVGLLGIFLLAAGFLIWSRFQDKNFSIERIADAQWGWLLTALLVSIVLGVAFVLRGRPEQRVARWLDLALPLALGLLSIGLIWGLFSDLLYEEIFRLALKMNLLPDQLRIMLTYGLPAILCYTFVERSVRFGLGVGAILLASAFCGLLDKDILLRERSFYGVLQVETKSQSEEPDLAFFGPTTLRWEYNRLIHGTTLHGQQYAFPPEMAQEALTYYHRSGPIGHLMSQYNPDSPDNPKHRLAVIGLGTGSMSIYALPGQTLVFYDIDPLVKRISYDTDKYFSFVSAAVKRGATIELKINDARLELKKPVESEADKFGMMFVDAFSSDAIPIHLITQEVMQIYLGNLREDGILVFHVSNRYLDLKPVLARLANAAHLVAYYESDDDGESYPGKTRSTWVALARKPEYLKRLNFSGIDKIEGQPSAGICGLAIGGPSRYLNSWIPVEIKDNVGLWTDNYSNLWSVFNW